MAARWFAAQTQPGGGRTAKAHLKQQDYTAFLPEFRVGNKTSIYFPGYIFIFFDIEGVRWRSINGTRGIIKLLPIHMEIPQPLPDGFVEDLQAFLSSGDISDERAEEMTARYLPNETVRVASGPFGGYYGTLVRYRKGSLVLLMALLGQETVVAVPNHQIVPRDRKVEPRREWQL